MTVAGLQIGVDENGLGPRLGPMIVTAVLIEVDADRVRTQRAFTKITSGAGIGDSKAECAHGSMGNAEAIVLAILHEHVGFRWSSFSHLATTLSLDDEAALRGDCPDGHAPRACFDDPIALPAFGMGPERSHFAAAQKLLDEGVRLRAARVGVTCAKRMNQAREAGQSRFDLDLATMVRLIDSLHATVQRAPLMAYCGKVGGRQRYSEALERLSPLIGVIEETRARSSYLVPRLGEVHFVMDGDATEPAIGLASMIGKYVRELWMHRINRYWMAAVPGTTPVSGYHEPMTERFVALTARSRKERNIPDECFER